MKILNTVEEVRNWVKVNKFAVVVVHSKTCVVCEHFLPELEGVKKETGEMYWASFDAKHIEKPFLETNAYPSVMVFKDTERVFVGVGAAPIAEVKKVMEAILDGTFKSHEEIEAEQLAILEDAETDEEEAEEADCSECSWSGEMPDDGVCPECGHNMKE